MVVYFLSIYLFIFNLPSVFVCLFVFLLIDDVFAVVFLFLLFFSLEIRDVPILIRFSDPDFHFEGYFQVLLQKTVLEMKSRMSVVFM